MHLAVKLHAVHRHYALMIIITIITNLIIIIIIIIIIIMIIDHFQWELFKVNETSMIQWNDNF